MVVTSHHANLTQLTVMYKAMHTHMTSVADPGFPVGRAPTSDVGAFRQKRM